MGAPLDSKDRAGGDDALGQQVQDAAGTAAKVHDAFARLDADLLELSVRSGARSAI
jgi:hypothetical protein